MSLGVYEGALPATIGAMLMKERWWEDPREVLRAFKDLQKLEGILIAAAGLRAIQSTPENGIHVAGRVMVEGLPRILPGTVIYGPVLIGANVRLGPNCTVFGPSIIGPRTSIGPGVEVRRSILFSDVRIAHMAYVGHSVVGHRVNIGAGFISAVRNLKRRTVHIRLGKGYGSEKRALFDTKEELFGTIIADDVEFGVCVTTLPGRVVVRRSQIMPFERITDNL